MKSSLKLITENKSKLLIALGSIEYCRPFVRINAFIDDIQRLRLSDFTKNSFDDDQNSFNIFEIKI